MDRAAYSVALENVTRYGISQAVRAIIQGSLDHVFFPSPPELRKECDRAMEPHWQRRRDKLNCIDPPKTLKAGARDRMKLKVPMLQAAWGNPSRMNALAIANSDGFEAMAALAQTWGVPVPQELWGMPSQEAERQWKQARSAAWVEIEANPPPYLVRERNRAKTHP